MPFRLPAPCAGDAETRRPGDRRSRSDRNLGATIFAILIVVVYFLANAVLEFDLMPAISGTRLENSLVCVFLTTVAILLWAYYFDNP